MPLPTQADIALGTRAQQVRDVSYPAIEARYPNAARDALKDPPRGFFDLVADADAVLAARGSLLATERRRFAVEVDGLIWFDVLAFPGVRLVDPELSVDLVCMVTRWQVDCENERTLFELMG